MPWFLDDNGNNMWLDPATGEVSANMPGAAPGPTPQYAQGAINGGGATGVPYLNENGIKVYLDANGNEIPAEPMQQPDGSWLMIPGAAPGLTGPIDPATGLMRVDNTAYQNYNTQMQQWATTGGGLASSGGALGSWVDNGGIVKALMSAVVPWGELLGGASGALGSTGNALAVDPGLTAGSNALGSLSTGTGTLNPALLGGTEAGSVGFGSGALGLAPDTLGAATAAAAPSAISPIAQALTDTGATTTPLPAVPDPVATPLPATDAATQSYFSPDPNAMTTPQSVVSDATTLADTAPAPGANIAGAEGTGAATDPGATTGTGTGTGIWDQITKKLSDPAFYLNAVGGAGLSAAIGALMGKDPATSALVGGLSSAGGQLINTAASGLGGTQMPDSVTPATDQTGSLGSFDNSQDVTGTPLDTTVSPDLTGGSTDPNAALIQTMTAQGYTPAEIQDAIAQQQPVDPNTGVPIDTTTGQPIPDTGTQTTYGGTANGVTTPVGTTTGTTTTPAATTGTGTTTGGTTTTPVDTTGGSLGSVDNSQAVTGTPLADQQLTTAYDAATGSFDISKLLTIPNGLSLLSAALGANATNKAANAQQQSIQQALAQQMAMYQQTRSDQAPWLQAGTKAVNQLSGMTAPGGDLVRPFTSADLNADPVYQSGLQFGLDQGTKGINARAIGNGMYNSGATLKALTQFGNDYGSTKANDSFNRYQTQNSNIYNKIAGVAGLGQTAANQVQSANTSTGNSTSNLLTDAGNSRAASVVGGTNQWGTALGNIANNMNGTSSQNAILKALGINLGA